MVGLTPIVILKCLFLGSYLLKYMEAGATIRSLNIVIDVANWCNFKDLVATCLALWSIAHTCFETD